MSIVIKCCSKCKFEKEEQFFYKDSTKSLGLSSYCKECRIKRTNDYNKENPEKVKLTQKNHYINNKDNRDLKNKQWIKNNPDKEKAYRKKQRSTPEYKAKKNAYRREYRKNRKLIDPLYKLEETLRSRLNIAIKKKFWQKNTNFIKIIDCSLQELKEYIEKQFKPGMSWENHGLNGWHIDHIIPLNSAQNLDNLYKLNHYTNLQPLWASENYKKGHKCP